MAGLTLTPDGLELAVGDVALAALAEAYDTSHHVKLEGFFAPALLERCRGWLAEGGFVTKRHGAFGVELCLEPGALTNALTPLMNDPVLLDVVDRITSVGPFGCFEGRVYRVVPGRGHTDGWHTDMVAGRLVALSVNLSERPYVGGALQLRRAGSEDVLVEVPNLGPGDAILFRLSHALEHRITDIAGSEPKTAYAGWFRLRPDYRDIVAGRAGW